MASPFIEYVSKDDSLHIFGIRLLGASIQNGRKLLLTHGFILLLWAIGASLHWIAGRFGGDRQKVAFWSRQGIKILLFVLGVVFFVSIWFDNPARLATGAGRNAFESRSGEDRYRLRHIRYCRPSSCAGRSFGSKSRK